MTSRLLVAIVAFLVVGSALTFAVGQRRIDMRALLISPETREIVVLPSIPDSYVLCTAATPTGPRRGCISVGEMRKALR